MRRGNGIYGPGDTVEIALANATEALEAGGQIRVTLSNGEEPTLTVTSAGSNQLRGDYTVAADDTSDGDLDVVSFLPGDGVDDDTVPKDLFGNPMTSTTMPTNMIADTQDIVVDTLRLP